MLQFLSRNPKGIAEFAGLGCQEVEVSGLFQFFQRILKSWNLRFQVFRNVAQRRFPTLYSIAFVADRGVRAGESDMCPERLFRILFEIEDRDFQPAFLSSARYEPGAILID